MMKRKQCERIHLGPVLRGHAFCFGCGRTMTPTERMTYWRLQVRVQQIIFNAFRYLVTYNSMNRLTLIALCFLSTAALARDHGQFANSTPEMKSWFNGLSSGKGPCCSDADGTALSDVDWETRNGKYRVRIKGEWIDVPDNAVLDGPNKAGVTIVWPMYQDGKVIVRCFIPGSMT